MLTSTDEPQQADGSRGLRRGRRPKLPPPRGNRCLNCGREPVHTRFCPDCGQENVSYAVPLPALLHDLGEEFIKWDGRLVRTLGALLTRPGKFTVEYNAGRRAHYLSPFKLYFVVTALLFFVLVRQGEVQQMRRNFDSGVRQSLGPVQIGAGDDRAAAKGDITWKASLPQINGRPVLPADYRYNGEPLRPGNLADAYGAWLKDPANPRKDTGLRMLFARQFLRMLDHPASFVDQFVQNLSRAMFFLVPLYAVLLAGLFRGARRYFLEHLVFAVNHHTVGFLVGLALIATPDAWTAVLISLLLGYWVYEFFSLRRVYGQGKRLTLFKQFVLNQVYFWGLIFAVIGVALASVALL